MGCLNFLSKSLISFFFISIICSTAFCAQEPETLQLTDKKYFVALEMINSNDNIVGIISACSALIAIIVGPIATLYIAKKQIIYPINKKHADNFDDVTAKYFNLLDGFKKGIDCHLLDENERQDLISSINLHRYKIWQMVEPEIPINSELINNMETLNTLLDSRKIDHAAFEATKNKIWSLSRDIARYKNRLG